MCIAHSACPLIFFITFFWKKSTRSEQLWVIHPKAHNTQARYEFSPMSLIFKNFS